MPRYAEKITEQELVDKILEAYNNHEEAKEHHDVPVTKDTDMYCYLKYLTPTVIKDLSKIDFDGENRCEGMDCFSSHTPDIMGVHTTSTGVTYYGCMMGGDWEFPIYFIIYWDGKELRGYIPTNGQCYDEECKAAYGSGKNEEPEDPAHDPVALLADIENRIEIKGAPKVNKVKTKKAAKKPKSKISYKTLQDNTKYFHSRVYNDTVDMVQQTMFRCKGNFYEDKDTYANNLVQRIPELVKYLTDPNLDIYEVIAGLECALQGQSDCLPFGVAMAMNELYGGDPHTRNPTAVMPERYAHILASDYIARKLINIGNIDEKFVLEARAKFPLAKK
jgi:hypothetical protein